MSWVRQRPPAREPRPAPLDAGTDVAPEIGAAPVVVLTVAAQQLASVAVDRHGLPRLPRREVSARRLLGVSVLVAGVALTMLG